MKKSIALACLLAALVSNAHGETSDAAAENKYLATKERIPAQIAKVGAHGSDALISAMADSEDQLIDILQTVLKPPHVKDLDARVILPIDDFEPGTPGADQADGLIFGANDLTIFETTDRLFTRYVSRHGKKINARRPEQSEALYSSIFDWDARFEIFDEIPLKPSAAKLEVHAYLGMWAQDVGPWNPESIVLFIKTRGRVYVANAKLPEPAAPIQTCNAVYAVSVHDTPQQKDAEEKQFQQYLQCWRTHAHASNFYKDTQKFAQDLSEAIALP